MNLQYVAQSTTDDRESKSRVAAMVRWCDNLRSVGYTMASTGLELPKATVHQVTTTCDRRCHRNLERTTQAARVAMETSNKRCYSIRKARKATIVSTCCLHVQGTRRVATPLTALPCHSALQFCFPSLAALTSPSSQSWCPFSIGLGFFVDRSAAGLPICDSCVKILTRSWSRSSITQAW